MADLPQAPDYSGISSITEAETEIPKNAPKILGMFLEGQRFKERGELHKFRMKMGEADIEMKKEKHAFDVKKWNEENKRSEELHALTVEKLKNQQRYRKDITALAASVFEGGKVNHDLLDQLGLQLGLLEGIDPEIFKSILNHIAEMMIEKGEYAWLRTVPAELRGKAWFDKIIKPTYGYQLEAKPKISNNIPRTPAQTTPEPTLPKTGIESQPRQQTWQEREMGGREANINTQLANFMNDVGGLVSAPTQTSEHPAMQIQSGYTDRQLEAYLADQGLTAPSGINIGAATERGYITPEEAGDLLTEEPKTETKLPERAQIMEYIRNNPDLTDEEKDYLLSKETPASEGASKDFWESYKTLNKLPKNSDERPEQLSNVLQQATIYLETPNLPDEAKAFISNVIDNLFETALNERKAELDKIKEETKEDTDIPDPFRVPFLNVSRGMTKDERANAAKSLKSLIDNGDTEEAKEYLANLVTVGVGSVEETKSMVAREELIGILGIVSDGLNLLKISQNIDTGIVTKFRERMQKMFGETIDPDISSLDTLIELGIMRYRQLISGAAFTESEAKQYESVFPGIGKAAEVNISKIKAVLTQAALNQQLFYRRYLGKEGADLVGKGGTTPEIIDSPDEIESNDVDEYIRQQREKRKQEQLNQ